MLVISSALVVAAVADGLSLDHPLIGWRNVVTSTTIAAGTAEANYPASNLANPATHLEWRAAETSEQYLTITTNEVDPIDYIAVARHNFASAAIPLSVEGFVDGVWTELVEEVIVANDDPVLFRFVAQSLAQIRIRIQEGLQPARAAVVYCGKLLVIERKVWVGHTPLPHGRKASVANGRSETGNFLGRIVLGAWRESTIPLSLISPAWYRANMDAFLADAQRDLPFFFAWRPESYPREVGFAWLVDDPAPTPVGPSNLLAFDLKVGGIV
ncbi:hypothetical protein [Tardiphaga sp. 862_B3_N1_1]|uniref:hypothetical protein n=1 Tax=Tardiphaga sp. 862_B3_N1_1 TaxID=3240763 RepID=UPI003F88BAB9